RSLLDGGRYAEAEAAFTDFLHNFASSREAPEARYWLGYTLLARNNFTDAAQTFVDYLRRTPNGPNAPAAQVNLGMALAGMNQKPQACAAFADVPHRYPHAAPAVRARAPREAPAPHCAARSGGMSLLDRGTIERILQFSEGAPVLLALSGGGDSTALLHLLVHSIGALRLRACVIDHALREESSAEAAHAAGFAQALGVEARVVALA